MKNKPLLPSLKEKKRYVAFEIISKSRIRAFSKITESIYTSARTFAGDLGLAAMGLQVLPEKYSEDQKGILRVSSSHVDELKAALSLVDEIDGEEVIMRSLGVSGMLNKAEKYIAS